MRVGTGHDKIISGPFDMPTVSGPAANMPPATGPQRIGMHIAVLIRDDENRSTIKGQIAVRLVPRTTGFLRQVVQTQTLNITFQIRDGTRAERQNTCQYCKNPHTGPQMICGRLSSGGTSLNRDLTHKGSGASEKTLNIAEFQLHIRGSSMVALARTGRSFHVAQQLVHLLTPHLAARAN